MRPVSGTEPAFELLAREHHLRLRVDLEPRQHFLVADAAARVLVHDLDQLRDRAAAVADDVARRAAGRGDQFAVHDQEAMVVALEVGLDDHRARVLLRALEAGHDFRVARQADRDAAAVVAVVGLGHDREAEPVRGAHRLALALHQLLARHRQAERGEDAVGLFLVARELDRDVRRAAGDRRLDALLVLAVAQLDQRLVVEPQPRDVALVGGVYQRGRRRAERAALREADVLVAGGGPIPTLRHRARGAELFREQRTQEAHRELAGGDAFLALGVFIDDRVEPRLVEAARLAERDVLAGDVLQFERDVLEHMSEPGALVLVHAADEAAGFAVGTAVLGEAGQGRDQAVDEILAEPARGPGLECAEVEFQPDDRKTRVVGRPDVDGAVEDAHVGRP